MLRWRMMGTVSLLTGVLMLAGWLSAFAAPTVSAAPLLQPSPRPPIDRDRNSEDGGHKNQSQAEAYGHVTGTVINTTTGAPVPGVNVNVGGVLVTSDANGNYDCYVPAGDQTVVLALDPGQGMPMTGPQTVQVRSGEATVAHLAFADNTNVVPTTAPAEPTPMPTETPAAPPTMIAGASLPNNLPTTGGPKAQKPAIRASTSAAAPLSAPKHLPRTAEPATYPWTWPLAALALVMFGAYVLAKPTRAAATAHALRVRAATTISNHALLARLLGVDEMLLQELLSRSFDATDEKAARR